MSRISDTRIRTREAAARLVACGRRPHELTVDLIYAEIRQGSRTTINDELKLWKDEQARNDALSAALPPAVTNAMLSVWALAVEHGERVFAQRGEELEGEAASATARAESLVTVNAEREAEVRALRGQIGDSEKRLATVLADLARAQADRDLNTKQLDATAAELTGLRTESAQSLLDARQAHARELEALRTGMTGREAALRAEVDRVTTRLESVQKHIMAQADEARNAHRRAEAALSKTQQRNEQLIGEVERLTADAAEQRRLAEWYQQQLSSALSEARVLRQERDTLAQQSALLQGQLRSQTDPRAARPARRPRQEG
ncbi:DNA-binding protein [Burkholderia sp. R-69980]|nr:integrase [Burkholderia sp. ST111]MBK5124361.1 DNA-binding protein [Burkholderia sp. R-69980]